MTANITVLIIFIGLSICHLLGEGLENLKIRYLTKPLLMPLLALYYTIGNQNITWWILLGLIGGFGGDIFLMVIESDPQKSENFFTVGLISFLLGHIFYIVGLIQNANNFINFPLWGIFLMLPFIFIAIGVAFILLPAVNKDNPDMKLPLSVYIGIIGIMSVSTVFSLGSGTGVIFLMLGAALFITSDSILAYNKFKKKIPHERILVMSTYILAQFFIVQGILIP